jgi:hypothetical protein
MSPIPRGDQSAARQTTRTAKSITFVWAPSPPNLFWVSCVTRQERRRRYLLEVLGPAATRTNRAGARPVKVRTRTYIPSRHRWSAVNTKPAELFFDVADRSDPFVIEAIARRTA